MLHKLMFSCFFFIFLSFSAKQKNVSVTRNNQKKIQMEESVVYFEITNFVLVTTNILSKLQQQLKVNVNLPKRF